jgi:nitrate/nitrite transport system permease protein
MSTIDLAGAAPGRSAAAPRWQRALNTLGRGLLTHVLPPLIVVAVLLGAWELLSSRPGAALPAPSQVVQETWELIVNPFADNGGNDKGLGWQILASLERVAQGYALAVVAAEMLIGGVGIGFFI